MTNRKDMMIWMKDLIDHMAHCHDQLQWADEGPAQAFLADSLLGDLTQCRRICEQLRQTQGSREQSRHFPSSDSASTQVAFRDSMVLA